MKFPGFTYLIVIVKEKETAREIIEIINSFLEIRGLRLSESKTKITHIEEGFDFLGWNFRKYQNGHLLIKPSIKSIKRFTENMKLKLTIQTRCGR